MVQVGLRQACYMGQSKVKLEAVMIAAVANQTLMAKAIFYHPVPDYRCCKLRSAITRT